MVAAVGQKPESGGEVGLIQGISLGALLYLYWNIVA